MSAIDGAQPYRPRRPGVIDEEFEGEAVIVNLESGVYYAFNQVASTIWAALIDGRSPAAIAAAIGAAPDVVVDFCGRLLEEGLIEVASGEAGRWGGDVPGEPVGGPELQRFTDMQDLLLLDPIHDIDLDGDGWPLAPTGR